MHHFLKNWDQT